MTDTVNFDIEHDSGSLQRARDSDALIEYDPTTGSYTVCFPDSDDVHQVELHRHPDGWRGDCWMLNDEGERTGRCRGWAFHDGPCAHLWTVRSQLARERLEDHDRRHDNNIERAVADGGRDR